MQGAPPSPITDETWRMLAEEASDGMFLTDGALRIVWLNRMACEQLGYPREQLVGRCIPEFFYDRDEIVSEPLRREDLLAGQTTHTQRSFRTRDGERRVLAVSARAVGNGILLGIARDVTEQLRERARLERSEASFRALIERSPDGTVVHSDGVIRYANSAMAAMLKYASREELIGRRVIDLVHPDDRGSVKDRMRLLGAGEKTVPFIEERLVRSDGDWVLASIGAVSVEFEGMTAIAAIVRDITVQRQMAAQLAQADKMASLGLLAAGVAHEVNNPLAYLMLRLHAIPSACAQLRRTWEHARESLEETLGAGAVQALETGRVEKLLADIEEHAATASEGAVSVQRIVRDLAIFSRSDDDGRQVLDVHTAIERALSMARHTLAHRARVVREFSDVPLVRANEGRLSQVFLNLLLNACHALPEGNPESHLVRIATAFEDGQVSITITDTGCGIPPEDLKRLFEPFFTTRPVGAGTGLGLSVCHGIITSLGGTIRAESREGAGTTFTVCIPAA